MRAALIAAALAALLLTAAASPAERTISGPPTCAVSATREADVGSFLQIATCAPFFRSQTSYLPATFRLTSGRLPPGLSLWGNDSPAAQVDGTPTLTGTYVFTIGASDALGGRASGTYTVTVFPKLVLSGVELPRGVMGDPYSATISASGGNPPYTYGPFSLDGLSLDASSGVLGGTIEPRPPNGGVPALVCPFELKVTDASGASAVASFGMPVYDQDGSGPFVAGCALELPRPFVFVSGVAPRRAAVPASVGKQAGFVRAVRVTISGRGLAGVTAVTFARRPADFTIRSDGLLDVFVPTGARSGAIMLTTYDGHSWKAGAFTVTR